MIMYEVALVKIGVKIGAVPTEHIDTTHIMPLWYAFQALDRKIDCKNAI